MGLYRVLQGLYKAMIGNEYAGVIEGLHELLHR